MATIGDVRQARSHVPHLHCIVPGARGDTFAIGRPGHRSYESHMAVVGQGIAFSSRFPHLHCIVPGARGDTFAIGRPGHGTHISGMAAISEDVAFRGRIHYLLPVAASHTCTVWSSLAEAMRLLLSPASPPVFGITCPPGRVPAPQTGFLQATASTAAEWPR